MTNGSLPRDKKSTKENTDNSSMAGFVNPHPEIINIFLTAYTGAVLVWALFFFSFHDFVNFLYEIKNVLISWSINVH